MRRLFILAALALTLLPATAQTDKTAPQARYSITGKAPAGVSTVYLVNVAGREELLDSAVVSDGRFRLEGSEAKNHFFGISLGQNALLFLNDGTPIEADLGTLSLKGSALNERLNGYDRGLDSLSTKMEPLNREFEAFRASGNHTQAELRAFLETLRPQIEAFQKEQAAYVKTIISENRDNLIPAIFVPQVVTGEDAQAELKEYFNPAYAYVAHPAVARVKSYLEAQVAKDAIIGTRFIDLEENDTEGKAHRLSEYVGKGQYVLIDFWASWCGPCMAEMPNVKANYDKYHAKGFQVVGLSLDRDAAAWKATISGQQLNWIHLSDLKFWKSVAASTYGINSIPSSLLVDPEGKIVARDLRGEALGRRLAEIYGE